MPPAGDVQRRIAGLDGVRGLAALYVVVNHIFLRAFPGYPVDTAPFWAAWLIYGRFAVVVFIVLSGLSLTLAPARHGWRLDAVSSFARRRAWRILPPYWAALVFSLLVRRRGAIAMVGMVTLVVVIVGIVGPHVSGLDTFVIQSAPDLAALFALGVLAGGIVIA